MLPTQRYQTGNLLITSWTHILLSVTNKYSSWISRMGIMTIDMISWSISKRLCHWAGIWTCGPWICYWLQYGDLSLTVWILWVNLVVFKWRVKSVSKSKYILVTHVLLKYNLSFKNRNLLKVYVLDENGTLPYFFKHFSRKLSKTLRDFQALYKLGLSTQIDP